MDSGFVTLIGAGCGEGLITLKGLRALKEADVLVYDDLLDGNLLCLGKPEAEKVYVGKRHGCHSMAQEEINALLIRKAKEGKAVARLKGGDSFVFGRGGEEIESLQKENIPYAVIPGVTSAVAVPENFGIPVTHRGVAQSFTVVTGHTAGETQEDYHALAKLRGTLIFLMGLHRIEKICTQLMENGKPADTPAAVLSSGFSEKPKRVNGTLGDIAARAGGCSSPAVIVIGQTAELDFSAAMPLPLAGVSVTVTGSRLFTASLSESLRNAGAFVKIAETIRIVPDKEKIPRSFSGYGWLVFTSANAVRLFFETIRERRLDVRRLSHLKFACVGAKTAELLMRKGFAADFIPSEYTAECLGKELCADSAPNGRILLLRAQDASPALPAALRKRGLPFDDLFIYTTVREGGAAACDTDYLVFASASGVESFFDGGGTLQKAKPVCIGAKTAGRLKQYGVEDCITARRHDGGGIIQAIQEDQK